MVRTIGESQIRAELQGLQQPGVRIDDAIVDPRQGVLVVTFSLGLDYANRNAIIAGAALGAGGFQIEPRGELRHGAMSGHNR